MFAFKIQPSAIKKGDLNMGNIMQDIKTINEMVHSIDWGDVLAIAGFIIIVDRIKKSVQYSNIESFSKILMDLNANINNLILENFQSKEVLVFNIEMNTRHLLKLSLQKKIN